MGRRGALVALVGVAVVLAAGRTVASVYTDRLWYDAMGASAVWRSRATYTMLTTGLSALIAGSVIFLNLYAVRRSIVSLVLPRRVANIEIGQEIPPHYLMGAVVALSVLFGVLLALPADTWVSTALAMRGLPFGESDPYFQADLAFFVYWLPFETRLYVWSLITLLTATALVLFLYALTPSLKMERGSLHVSGYVRRHITVIAALFLVLLAWSFRLDGFQLLLDGSGPDGEFQYVDRQFGLRAAAVLAFVTIGAAVVVLWTGWAGQLPLVFGAVSIVLVLSFVLKQLVPALELGVGPAGDVAARELPYLAIRRGYTQRAFAVDEIVTSDGSAGFASWEEAARGVPLWDGAVLARTLGWAHGRAVSEATTGLQMTASGLTATVAVPPPDSLDQTGGDNPWILARARETRTDGRGGAVRVDRHGIAIADDEALPLVLVHPGAGAYRLVVDSLGLVPAPRLQRFSSRLAHAWSLQNFRLLFGEQMETATSIVTRRDLRERIDALAPFFEQGAAVHTAVVSDTLYWIVDLYATSESYPFSAPVTVAGASRKYFQHAGTAIVTATTGHVRLIRATELDPVTRSWVALFPTLFAAPGDLPRGLAEILPPAEDGAHAQATVFARFGTRRDATSGGKLPAQYGEDELTAGATTRIVLPASDPAATWVQPILDATDRVRGLVLATGGASRVTLWIPAAPSSNRWAQLLERMPQQADTAPPPRDTRWIRGAVRAFPVAGRVAFVQTTYAWRTTTPPAIERVTLLAGDSLVAGPTLGHAVGVALGPNDAGPLNPLDFRARVESLHAAMRAAIRRGDWAGFGDAFDALGALLDAPRPLVPPPALP